MGKKRIGRFGEDSGIVRDLPEENGARAVVALDPTSESIARRVRVDRGDTRRGTEGFAEETPYQT